MKRRTVLASCGTLLATTLAGCGGGGGDSGSDGGSTDGEATATESMDTPVETETPTATESMDTPVETETPTATPTPQSGFTHEVGEMFTVGEGENAIQYRVREYYRADEIGDVASKVTADGTYLIVILEVGNPRDESLTLPRKVFRVRRGGTWQSFDEEATEKVGTDERIDVDPIVGPSILSGNSQTGAIVFDVDPDQSYRAWITPAGSADTPEHFVPIGQISSVQRLTG